VTSRLVRVTVFETVALSPSYASVPLDHTSSHHSYVQAIFNRILQESVRRLTKMPLGFERLNERVKRPNPHINFIRPLPGSSESIGQDYLERIAAQCYPVMKSNHIYVMALEEYEPNPEFAGRNFNAGEVIQLVLKSRNGSWLPFRHVQMVMMHELAHCKQMNHSRAFWKERNAYAAEMRVLWEKRYTGEGFWSAGWAVGSGDFMSNQMPDASALPEHICGGTYRRSRGRKRKRGQSETPQLTYAERKQRRILKKFGAGGLALGSDEDERIKLEVGKKPAGKPRVAGSKRGRELRAAAALARFEKKAKEEEVKKEEPDSDTESEYEWLVSDEDAAVDFNGKKVVDAKGRGLVKVCPNDDENDEDCQREMQELMDVDRATIDRRPRNPQIRREPKDPYETEGGDEQQQTPQKPKARGDDSAEGDKQTDGTAPAKESQNESATQRKANCAAPKSLSTSIPSNHKDKPPEITDPPPITTSKPAFETPETVCPACSFHNPADSLTCLVCSNVLDPSKMTNHWRCTSEACRRGCYINIGDYGRCQICGSAKPVENPVERSASAVEPPKVPATEIVAGYNYHLYD
jgi:DNA-dependent metalloprotease WSS1